VLTSGALTARSSAIEPADLPTPHLESKPARTTTEAPHEARAENIREALRQCSGHRGRAAELLGISRATLYRHLELYAIDPSEFESRAKR